MIDPVAFPAAPLLPRFGGRCHPLSPSQTVTAHSCCSQHERHARQHESLARPAAAQLYDVELEPGDVVVFGSDGLFDNVWDHDIAAVVADSIAVRAPGTSLAQVQGCVEDAGMRCLTGATAVRTSEEELCTLQEDARHTCSTDEAAAAVSLTTSWPI